MMDHTIYLLTLVFTVVGVTIAAAGFVYAVKTLRAGVESLRLAAEEAKRSTEVARAQFWVMVRGVLANYDDVHANLRPEGIWGVPKGEKYSVRGPQDAAEWARVELYMGMFEYCEALISRRLLEQEDFRKAYRYRLNNLVHNAVIVEEKLHTFRPDWKDFWDLCERLDVDIPSRDELPQREGRPGLFIPPEKQFL
jgi:hypothetical protein